MSRIMQNEALDMNLMVCRCGGCCNNGHMYIVNVEFQKAKYTNVAKTRKVIFICAHMSTTSQYEWLVANLHSPKLKGGLVYCMAMCALSVRRVGIAATSQRCHQWVGGHRGHQQMEEVWAWNKLTDHDSTTTEGQQQQTAELDKRHAADSRVDIHQDLGIDSTHTLDPKTFWICKNNLSDVRICNVFVVCWFPETKTI